MKKHFLYYFGGLATGLMIGAVVFFIAFSNENSTNPEQKAPRKSPPRDRKSVENIQSHKKELKNKPQQKAVTDDNIRTEQSKKEDTLPKTDSVQNKAKVTVVQDTILNEYDSTQYHSDKSDIVVMKDQMLYSDKYPVHQLSEQKKNKKSEEDLDSLLIDVEYNKNDKPDSFRIEFWRSPINYKGYKRINQRLIIFGFTGKDTIKIFKNEDQMFFRLRDKKFPLDETNEFRSIWFDS